MVHQRHRAPYFLAVLAAVLVVGALSALAEDEPARLRTARLTEPGAPLLPATAGPFSPSFLESDGRTELDSAVLSDVATCEACHAQIVADWRSSAHRWASFDNPWYRASVDRFREVTGFAASRFCGGCHDLALLPEGGMDEAIEASDPRAHVGIACNACHGVRTTSVDGNASVSLSTAPIPLPVEGDPASLAAHRARVAPLDGFTDALCVSCHRGFMGPPTGNPDFLIGMDDATAWQRSSYAGTGVERLDDLLPAQGCRDCHMPAGLTEPPDVRTLRPSEGPTYPTHRFVGAQTSLAAGIGDAEQLARTEALLRSAVTLDIAALRRKDGAWVLPADGAPIAEGERVELDVVIRNVGTGHRFPAGTIDLQDTWLEVEVRDATGALVAEAGTQHAATGDDPTAHVLRSFPLRDEAGPELHHVVSRMRAVAWDHSIPARDATVARYELQVPERLDGSQRPLEVVARLRHRRHHAAFRELVCTATRSERGHAFALAGEAREDPVPDGCAEAPVVEVAQARAVLGGTAGERAGSERPTWRRLYDHGLALSHDLAERLDEARPSLEAAWEGVLDAGSPREQAMVLVLRAELEGKEGRVDAALDLLAEAEALAPDEPAVDFRRGEALAAVWRWDEAAAAYQRVVDRVPDSDLAWQRLAQARASLGDHEAALAAAHHGLALQPREAGLLLVQALALEALGAPEAEVQAARAAYLDHRPPDRASGLRYRCFREVPGCADERLPITTRVLRTTE